MTVSWYGQSSTSLAQDAQQRQSWGCSVNRNGCSTGSCWVGRIAPEDRVALKRMPLPRKTSTLSVCSGRAVTGRCWELLEHALVYKTNLPWGQKPRLAWHASAQLSIIRQCALWGGQNTAFSPPVHNRDTEIPAAPANGNLDHLTPCEGQKWTLSSIFFSQNISFPSEQ